MNILFWFICVHKTTNVSYISFYIYVLYYFTFNWFSGNGNCCMRNGISAIKRSPLSIVYNSLGDNIAYIQTGIESWEICKLWICSHAINWKSRRNMAKIPGSLYYSAILILHDTSSYSRYIHNIIVNIKS